MARFLTILCLTVLCSCTAAQTTQVMDGTMVAYQTAQRLAGVYAMLPACGSVGTSVCSDKATVAKINAALVVAKAAVVAAQKSNGQAADVVAANVAVAALVALIPEIETNN